MGRAGLVGRDINTARTAVSGEVKITAAMPLKKGDKLRARNPRPHGHVSPLIGGRAEEGTWPFVWVISSWGGTL